jgi:hypothetical protein
MNYYRALSEGADRAIARVGFSVRSSWTLVQKDEEAFFLPPGFRRINRKNAILFRLLD